MNNRTIARRGLLQLLWTEQEAAPMVLSQLRLRTSRGKPAILCHQATSDIQLGAAIPAISAISGSAAL